MIPPSAPIRRALALALLAATAAARPAAADLFELGTPFVRGYEVADGLPQSTVHALLVDRTGALWAGTQDGAASYDGRSWHDLDLPSRGQANFVRALLETPDGALWVASQGAGLLRRQDGTWTRFDPDHGGFPDLRVNALAATSGPGGARLWAATHSSGLLAWDGRQWRRWTTAEGLPGDRIWDVLPVGDGDGARLWLATERGPAWLELPDGPIVVPAGAPVDSASSLETTVGAEGTVVWVGLYGGGLARFAAGTWTRLGASEGLPSPFVTDLARRPADPRALWVATDGGGLARVEGTRLLPVELGARFSSRAAYRLLETTDAEGADALWVGTRNNGLLRLMEGYFRSFAPFPEIPRSPVTALLVAEDAPGGPELWLGTDGYGVARWKQGAWTRFTGAQGALGHDAVLALADTRAVGGGRQVWVGTRNGGLAAWDGVRWRRHDQRSAGLPSDLVQTLLETVDDRGRGTLWVGTREGLASFDGTRWRQPGVEDGWPRESVLALLEERDAQGRPSLWIGTAAGLWRWRAGALRRWTERDGLPNPTVNALHVRRGAGGRRELWVGTDGGGAVWLDLDSEAGELEPLSRLGVPPLPNGVVYDIVEDAGGRLYLPTNRGVARLTFRAAGRPAAVELLTVEHGLPNSQGNRGAAHVDAHGRIWIGTVGGAAAFDPRREPRTGGTKRLVLEGAFADGSGRRLAAGARLAHDDAHLVFRYSLRSFFGESRTRYRSQLVGREAVPSAWTPSAERELAEVPAGEHVFRVWGRDAAGVVAGPAELAFTVLPAPWATPAARAAAAAALIGAVLLLLGARARVHERREQRLETVIAARTARLQRANALLIELSYVDSVTSIPNRRRFDELLAQEWQRGLRTGAPLAVVMADVDRFKAYNDTYGHPRGDECLRLVAQELADALPRGGDAIARYGGEEFGIILPVTDLEGAQRVAENLRRRVEALAVPHAASDVARVITVSCGVAVIVPTREMDADVLLRAADRALYEAKRAGRNRIAAAG